MAGSPAVASRESSKPAPSNMRRKRAHAELDNTRAPPSSSSSRLGAATTDPIDLTDDSSPSRKRRLTEASHTPRTLPMEPHAELLAELHGKYVMLTATVISSSKIEKKVTAVLSHLGHIDMFSQTSVPGVVMLHARAGETSKLVTVMELAKRRMHEQGHKWYQYNRVYDVAEEPRGGGGKGVNSRRSKGGSATAGDSDLVVEDTLPEVEEEADDETSAFEPTKPLHDLTVQDKPATESKNAYMSIFLSRVPMPELAAKPSFSLQTNRDQIDAQKEKVLG